MKVFIFHLMPYANLDMGFKDKYRAAWVVLPNTYYDPKKGHELYNRYLDELEMAAELGFDGISVNEHHQNAYGLMPSPVVTASALSRRTGKAKIAILGNAFCLREHPLNIAEEHAMIDCITGGRLITGMVRGIGAEYFSMGANPAYLARALPGGARSGRAGLDQARAVRLRGQVLSLRVCEPVAAAVPAAASADLGAVDRLDRDHRMGGASVAQVCLSAGLQPGAVGGALSELLPRMRAADVRLHRKLRADRLVDAGVCRRHRRAGPRRGQAAYRGAVQPAAAAAVRDAVPAGLPLDQVAEEHAQPQAQRQRPGAHHRHPDRAGHHHLRQPGHGAPALHRDAPAAGLPEPAAA